MGLGLRNGGSQSGGLRRTSRIGSRAALIGLALLIQAVVLGAGWFWTFRVVQRSFAREIQDYTIEQNRELARRVASLFPVDAISMPEFGSAGWERLQGIIESEALQQLPAGGFACLIEPDGQLLCHPEIRESPGLRNFSFDGMDLLANLDEGADAQPLSGLAGANPASGVVEFSAGDFHYVATQPLAGSDLRLLVHQPVGSLVRVGEQETRWVMGVAAIAVIGVLGVTGVGLSGLLRRYDSVHERLNRTMRENLDVARRIQEGTFPSDLPRISGYDIAGWSRPAEETGGDTFDVVPLAGQHGEACAITPNQPTQRVALLLADATGHGIGPALAVTQLHAMTRLAWRLGGSLVDVVRLVNEQLVERLPDGRFVTAMFGTLDAPSGRLELISAGQGPLLAFRAASGTVETIGTDTFPLGVAHDLGVTSPTSIRLMTGDVFCVISDGLLEAMNGSREQFGAERLRSVLMNHAGRPAREIANQLELAVNEFTGNAPPDDDRTVVILKRDPAA